MDRCAQRLEEAGLEFDGGSRLYSRLCLSRCGLGVTVSLSGSDGRLESGLESRCRPDNSLEGSRVQRTSVHQVLKGKLMQAFRGGGGRGEGRVIQQVRDEGRDQQSQ